MARLFEPLTIRDIRFQNRIAMSPMCQYSCENGHANDWHLVHLGSRAVGGAGLIMMEATAVEPRGRISPEDMGIWQDSHMEMLSRITLFIQEAGVVPGIQLAHAGRKASMEAPWVGNNLVPISSGGWQPVAPSAVPFSEQYPMPKALTSAEIKTLVQNFQDAARRALESGFQVIEIHAAHGYLINTFLSPLSNQRTDEYGGSFENRTRFLKDVIQSIRDVWPERLPLFVRISATDWIEGGWDIEQSVQLAKEIKPLGVDLIDCSSGGLLPHVKIPTGPGYQVPFAHQIREESHILTGAVGLITEAHQANEIIESGQADLILLGRELLRDPYWPLHAADALDVDMAWPKQYDRAKPRQRTKSL